MEESPAGGFDRRGGHVGFDRDLIGRGLESEKPAGLLAVFEPRIVLAAGLLPGAGTKLDQEFRGLTEACADRMLSRPGLRGA